MTFQNKFCHVPATFKQLLILKIKEIYQLEPEKFMYKAHKGEISYKLDKEILKLSILHSHNKKLASNNFHLSRICTSFGKQTLT